MTSDSASRVTRNSPRLRPWWLPFVACLTAAGALQAQHTGPAVPGAERTDGTEASDPAGTAGNPVPAVNPKTTGDPAPAKSPPRPRDAGKADATGDGAPVAPAGSPPAGASAPRPGPAAPTPGHFEPTEKVRADFDVSFPVDI